MASPKKLTHLNEEGYVHMVDVTEKSVTKRVAIATGCIHMKEETSRLIKDGALEKGDVLAVARIAGIMAAKKTADIIPLCHPLSLTSVNLDVTLKLGQIVIEAKTVTKGETGVEMEALHAVSAAALTIYDMCKAVDRSMTISDVRLVYKTGGRSGTYQMQSSS